MRLTAIAVAVVAGLAAPAAASAADYCIGVQPEGVTCTTPAGDTRGAKLATAFAQARDADTPTDIHLGVGTYTGNYDVGSVSELRVFGSGSGTVIEADGDHPALSAASQVGLSDMTLRTRATDAAQTVLDLPFGGTLRDVRLVGAAQGTALTGSSVTADGLRIDGARRGVAASPSTLTGARITTTRSALAPTASTAPSEVRSSVLESTEEGSTTVFNEGAPLELESTVVRSAGTAVTSVCTRGSAQTALHRSTVAAAAAPALFASCTSAGPIANVVVDRSILAPGVGASRTGDSAGILLTRSRWDGPGSAGPGVTADGAMRTEDPGFVSVTDLRLRPGSPLVDALPAEDARDTVDADGRPRVLDGNGDGTARSDFGAYERAPAAGPSTAGNVLVNGDAEGGPGSAPLDGWAGDGQVGTTTYGDSPRVPGQPFATTFAGGARMFNVSDEASAAAVRQTTDLTSRAAAIDGPGSTATLSGLLGTSVLDLPPSGASDPATVTATFRDAAGRAVGAPLAIGPVTADQLGYVGGLARRSASARVPAGARSVETVIAFADGNADGYSDGYADGLALTLADEPQPADPGGGNGGGGGDATPGTPRPTVPVPATPVLATYAGPALPGGRLRLDRKGRVTVPVACPPAAVGGCAGTLELSRPGTARAAARKRRKAVRLARAKVAVAAGKTQRVRLELSRKARRGLRKTTKVTLKLVTRDGRPGARAVTRTTTVRLVPPR